MVLTFTGSRSYGLSSPLVRSPLSDAIFHRNDTLLHPESLQDLSNTNSAEDSSAVPSNTPQNTFFFTQEVGDFRHEKRQRAVDYDCRV